ncbi:MAG: nitroreductase family deazaflavin-dependent oxidoreductase [Candidatus Nanopelagicales bacterium]
MNSPVSRAAAGMLRTRWLVRAPIWVYRARLGAVFGSRLLMLEHVGRKSGLRRYVTLEVVNHPQPGTYIVVSGFGTRSQWLRNVTANPEVRVWIASRKAVSAKARRLDSEAAAETLRQYAQVHPKAWANLLPVLEETLGQPIDDKGTGLPVVALELADQA